MTRTRLPDRRDAVNFEFFWSSDPRVRGTRFVGSLGFDRVGRPLEIFVHCEKVTTELAAMGRDAAVLVSLLLQWGCTFAEMRKSVTRVEDDRPASLVGRLLDEIEHVTEAEVRGLLR